MDAIYLRKEVNASMSTTLIFNDIHYEAIPGVLHPCSAIGMEGGGEGEICLLLRIFPLPTISPLLPKQNFFKLLKDKGRESYSITKLEVFPRMTLENFRAASPR